MTAAVDCDLGQVVRIYENLTQEWNKQTHNLDLCGRILSNLKVNLTKLAFLPTAEKANKQELLVSRDILEIGCLFSIEVHDITGFERYMAQLKCYYLDYINNLPESPYKYQLLGLNLLCLLSKNQLADFHTELELLPIEDLKSNIYLRHPVELEQYLMEGNYNKIFLLRDNVPAAPYKFFIDILLNTIRDEIASCVEKAYERLEFSEAARMLFFESQKPLLMYGEKRAWILDEKRHAYVFPQVTLTAAKSAGEQDVIPAIDLTKRTLSYACEVEKIV